MILLLERCSRFLVLPPNPDRRPTGVAQRIGLALGSLAPVQRRTVTFDRGFEFMGYPALARGLGVASYFCDPRSPWQKGAVENANGRLRRYLPGDVPAERLTAGSLDALAARLNATSRRCLGYQTPARCSTARSGPDLPMTILAQPCRIGDGKRRSVRPCGAASPVLAPGTAAAHGFTPTYSPI